MGLKPTHPTGKTENQKKAHDAFRTDHHEDKQRALARRFGTPGKEGPKDGPEPHQVSEGVREAYSRYQEELSDIVQAADKPVRAPIFSDRTADFMTGGNQHHNAAIDQVVTQRALEMLDERGVYINPAQVRRWVHDELRHYKVGDRGQHNGNVPHSEFHEILDNTVRHFGGRSVKTEFQVIGSSEDVNWRIEELIEVEFAKPENEFLWSDPRRETLRATLRTRLRAELAEILMNEAYVNRLEDIVPSYRSIILEKFEGRIPALINSALFMCPQEGTL